MTYAVGKAQTTPSFVTQTLAAGVAATIIAANRSVAGARILNWTASPVYLSLGTTGTPASGAPSDYIPAAAGGVPGQYVCEFAPVSGMRAVGAAAGDLTVVTW